MIRDWRHDFGFRIENFAICNPNFLTEKGMPKVKTRSTVAKRMRMTGGGKIKKQRAYGRHILTKKSSKRKRNLRSLDLVDAVDAKRIRRMLGC